MGAIYWILTCAVLLFGGVGLAVQTFVAQAFGGRRYAYASRALWNALWTTLALAPLFLGLAFAGRWLLHPFGLDPRVEALALEYWTPRMGGAFVGSMAWAAMGFFNGISAVRYTMAVVVVTTISNAVANQFFMFELGMGMKGSAWGTNVAQIIGVSLALWLFLRGEIGRRYRSALTWRPNLRMIRAQLKVGLPIGVMYGADVLGLALSQMMIAQTSAIGAAATQIVMALTSMAYLPTIGIALGGTTLVGQSIGAGSRDWAKPSRQSRDRAMRGAHGFRGRHAAAGGPVGAAVVREQRRAGRRTSHHAGPGAAVARRRVPDLRWAVLRRRLLPARCGRHAGAGRHRAGAVVVLFRAAGAYAHLRAGPGLDRWPAAIRPRRSRRLDRVDGLRDLVRLEHVLALAPRGVAQVHVVTLPDRLADGIVLIIES
jgi:hypothetical protein